MQEARIAEAVGDGCIVNAELASTSSRHSLLLVIIIVSCLGSSSRNVPSLITVRCHQKSGTILEFDRLNRLNNDLIYCDQAQNISYERLIYNF